MKRKFMGMVVTVGLLAVSLCGCGNSTVQAQDIEVASVEIEKESIDCSEVGETTEYEINYTQESRANDIEEKNEEIITIAGQNITEEVVETFADDEEANNKEKVGKQGLIIIGESHAVIAEGYGYAKLGSSVKGVVLNENLFFVHTAMDPIMGTYEWFSTDGANRIEQIIQEHNEIGNWTIISIHGTSMTTIDGITDKYIDTYKEWMKKKFADCDIYIVSVPPIDEAKWNEVHPDIPRNNDQIKDFNKRIKKKFSKNYFDLYDWIVANGEFIDEIHYSGKTYVTMFDQVIAKVWTNQ